MGQDGSPEEKETSRENGAQASLCVLGRGGMGEVHRVVDHTFGRTLAMKIASSKVAEHPALLTRFLEEAQTIAQLQRPGIIPVHGFGQLPDGRYDFTMKEMRGRTFGDVNAEVHGVPPTFVAYAHGKGGPPPRPEAREHYGGLTR